MNLQTDPRGMKAKLIQGVAAGLIGACLALVLYVPGWLDRWEGKTWDWRVSMMAKPSAQTDNVRLILLDQGSLDWARTENGLFWPWPREVYAPLIQFCERVGARALGFDVLFTEPSSYGVGDDRGLAEVMGNVPVAGTMFLSRETGSEETWPSFAPESGIHIEGVEEWIDGREYSSFSHAAFPAEDLAGAFDILSNVNMRPDPDSVYRRISLFERFDDKTVPSLALGTYLAADPDVPMMIRSGRLSIGDRTVPINDRGEAILNFRGPSGTHRAYSVASIIQSELRLQAGLPAPIDDLEAFKDTYVLFGFSAPGLYDLRPTPVSGVYPGVEVFATMLDNLLAGDFMRSSPLWVLIFLTFLVAIGAGVSLSLVSGIGRSVLVYAGLLAVPVVICFVAYRLGFWVPLVAQEVAVVTTLFSAGLINYTVEGRQKMFIKNAFSQYLSGEVINQIIAHPERLKLGGERRNLSIFFSDLEGFTSLSEGLDPEELTSFLNRYLSAMTDIIHEEDGTVDKYEGDAIIAFWNAPLEQSDHAARCVRAALRCQEKLEELRPEFRDTLGRDLNMRIGINTGVAVVGNMGSRSRFDYTMIGDAVNLAARLEGLNKEFESTVLVSQASMFEVSGAFPAREVATVAVAGRKEPVVLFEPFLPREMNEDKRLHIKLFSEALHTFYAGKFAQAEERFLPLADKDPVARVYSRKCREFVENPPDQWEGVWVFTKK